MKTLIIYGVAGGASAAARARRLSEDAQIVLFEPGADGLWLGRWFQEVVDVLAVPSG